MKTVNSFVKSRLACFSNDLKAEFIKCLSLLESRGYKRLNGTTYVLPETDNRIEIKIDGDSISVVHYIGEDKFISAIQSVSELENRLDARSKLKTNSEMSDADTSIIEEVDRIVSRYSESIPNIPERAIDESGYQYLSKVIDFAEDSDVDYGFYKELCEVASSNGLNELCTNSAMADRDTELLEALISEFEGYEGDIDDLPTIGDEETGVEFYHRVLAWCDANDEAMAGKVRAIGEKFNISELSTNSRMTDLVKRELERIKRSGKVVVLQLDSDNPVIKDDSVFYHFNLTKSPIECWEREGSFEYPDRTETHEFNTESELLEFLERF